MIGMLQHELGIWNQNGCKSWFMLGMPNLSETTAASHEVVTVGHDFASLRIWLTNMIKIISQTIAWAGAQHLHHEGMLSQSVFFSDAIPPPPLNAFPVVLFSWIGPCRNVLYVFLSHAYTSWFCLRCKHSLVRGEECSLFVTKDCKEVAFFSEH